MTTTHSEDVTATGPQDPGVGASHIEPDNIGVGMLSAPFALCAVSLVLVVVLLQAWFYNWKVDMLAGRLAPTDERQSPAEIAKMQRERIETYGWADVKTHARAIPITVAMKLVAEEYSPAVSKEAAAPEMKTEKKSGEK